MTTLESVPALMRQATSELLRLRAENERLRKALEVVLKTCEDGVIHRSETGKPRWSAFEHMKTVSRAAMLQHPMDDGTPMPESEGA